MDVKTFKTSDGATLYYVLKRQSANWKVCIHGLGGACNAWDPILKVWIEEGHSVLAWDLRGHGLQRHLKVAGIFARLTLRDGKPQYLADTPPLHRLHPCHLQPLPRAQTAAAAGGPD